MILIEAIRLGVRGQPASVRWRNPQTTAAGELPLRDLANWLALGGRAEVVERGTRRALKFDDEPRICAEEIEWLPRY
jgi:hypothetical protein